MKGLVLAIASAALAAAAGAALAQTAGIRPGLWEVSVRITSMQMPNAPAGMGRMAGARATTVRQCITPEDAARGPEQLLQRAKGCKFGRFSFAGGRLETEMTCSQGRGTMHATSTGTYTPTSFTATGRSVSSGPMSMSMTSVTTGHRIGDCRH